MIKNIVFDLGNVLVTFDPKSFLHDILHNKELEDKVYQFYFQGNLWNLYDMDVLTHEDMIQKGIEAFPDHKAEIKKAVKPHIGIPKGIYSLWRRGERGEAEPPLRKQ